MTINNSIQLKTLKHKLSSQLEEYEKSRSEIISKEIDRVDKLSQIEQIMKKKIYK